MKSLLYPVMGVFSAFLVLGLTQAVEGPAGKMNPCLQFPKLFSGPYHPPPMQGVPAGEYVMGDHGGAGWPEELPLHAVYIDEFRIDVFEVSNKEYCFFLNAAVGQGLIDVTSGVVYKKSDTEPYCDTHIANAESRIRWNGHVFFAAPAKGDHPVTHVSWYGAAAYANWRSARQGLSPCYDLSTWVCDFQAGGFRLPTEAEWEKACRGGEHNPYFDYPWGNAVDGSMANYDGSCDPFEEGGLPLTTPVGYYDGLQTPPGTDMANGYGLYDMAGNVWEWCNDWCEHDYYQYCVDNNIYLNPKGPSSSPFGGKSLRGGSWILDEFTVRCSFRHSNDVPEFRDGYVGFRLVSKGGK